MTCADAKLFLVLHRPGELDADSAELLETHLRDCASCRDLAQAERSLDAALGRAMKDVAVPEGAQTRLLARLQQRRVARRRVRVAGLAAAAALLLAVGIGAYVALTWPIPVDMGSIRAELQSKWSTRPSHITQWFADRGVAIELPAYLNYNLVHMYEFAEFQGVRVPHLLFHEHRGRRPAVLHVFVLSSSQFDVASLPATRDYAGNFTVEVRGNADDPFRYVAAYTSGDLTPFIQKSGLN